MEEHYGVRREEKWDIWSPSFNACSFFDPCSASSHSAAVQLQSVSRGLFSTLFNHCLIFLQNPNILSHLEDTNYMIQCWIWPLLARKFKHSWPKKTLFIGTSGYHAAASTKLDAFFLVSGDGRTIISFDRKYATMVTIQDEKVDESKTWTLFLLASALLHHCRERKLKCPCMTRKWVGF